MDGILATGLRQEELLRQADAERVFREVGAVRRAGRRGDLRRAPGALVAVATWPFRHWGG
jgi:hypothetical protein